ncbi:hypothetical protein NP233_g12566 [Leucocoprinus birnbaumii]|uniref:Uncharacterized protein n=1 Tax=Leucocoprinus birnbaumii TaxID=56174 RepID=A0AAD5YKB8_9AGAR|nr:hypothetical protein NP233_g12566 [Leucocoprinus birnbaumii]
MVPLCNIMEFTQQFATAELEHIWQRPLLRWMYSIDLTVDDVLDIHRGGNCCGETPHSGYDMSLHRRPLKGKYSSYSSLMDGTNFVCTTPPLLPLPLANPKYHTPQVPPAVGAFCGNVEHPKPSYGFVAWSNNLDDSPLLDAIGPQDSKPSSLPSKAGFAQPSLPLGSCLFLHTVMHPSCPTLPQSNLLPLPKKDTYDKLFGAAEMLSPASSDDYNCSSASIAPSTRLMTSADADASLLTNADPRPIANAIPSSTNPVSLVFQVVDALSPDLDASMSEGTGVYDNAKCKASSQTFVFAVFLILAESDDVDTSSVDSLAMLARQLTPDSDAHMSAGDHDGAEADNGIQHDSDADICLHHFSGAYAPQMHAGVESSLQVLPSHSPNAGESYMLCGPYTATNFAGYHAPDSYEESN